MGLFSYKNFRLRGLASLCLIFMAGTPCWAKQEPGGVVLLQGATIIDGVSDAPLLDQSVLIEGNRITAIVPDGSPVPDRAEIVDLDGKVLIPGLLDSHVHWLDWMGELFINHGVTSIVALTDLDREMRAGSHASATLPRLYHSGNRPGFSNDGSREEIRRAIGLWLENDPDMAHFPTYDNASRRAYALAAEEAHRAGFLVFGHAENAPSGIRDGMDVIEHVWGFTQAAMSAGDLQGFQEGAFLTWATFMTDWEVLDGMIADAIAAGTYLNPTLVYEWGGMSERASERELDDYRVIRNPDLDYVPDNLVDSVLAKHRQIKNFSSRYENMPFISHLPEDDRAEFEQGYRNVREFVRRFVNAGGKIQAGTDTITGGLPGLGVHQEMQMLVEAGLTPMQALKSATRWSAELLEGLNGARGPASVGSIEPGKLADLVVLGADPLADILNTQKIERVMKDGRWIELGYSPEYYTFTGPSRSAAGATFAPVISSITPSAVDAGHEGSRVVIEGSGFLLTSLIRVNGISVKTFVTSPRRIEFDLPASMVARPGPDPYRAPGPAQNVGIIGYRPIDISVFNPPPEGGLSNSIQLLVRPR